MVVQVRKRHLFDVTGLGAVVRRHLEPIAAAPAFRRLLGLSIVTGIVLAPFAALAELRLSRIAASEVPWELAPHQRGPEPAGGLKVRSLIPALGYVQRLDPRTTPVADLNAWGFHDDDFVVPKPRDVARIAVVGDSMTYGLAAGPASDTFSGRLEAALAARAPAGVRFDVANLGVEGYQALQNDAAMRHVALDVLDADLVVYAFFENDLSDTSLDFYQYRARYPRSCPGGLGDRGLFADYLGPGPLTRASFWVRMHSALYADYRYRRGILRYEVVLPAFDRLEQRFGGRALGAAIGWARRRSAFTSPCIEISDGERLALLAIRDMAAVARNAGVPFVLFKIPQGEFLGSGPTHYEDRFLRYAMRGQRGVHFVDPQRGIEARMDREGVGFRQLCASDVDCHPSPLGHQYLADELLVGLERDHLVDALIERVRGRARAVGRSR